jgi:DNA-binding transcriptional MerR regulator
LDVAEPSPQTPRRALLKSAEVCDMIKVQPYVLRSWEKEFPDLGTSRTAGGPRFYRPADVERVQRLKQLVFGEGLTIAGARRRLEEEQGTHDDELPFDDPPSGAVSADTRRQLDRVRRGLRAILEMLGEKPRHTGGALLSDKPRHAGRDDMLSEKPRHTGGNGAAAPAPQPTRRRGSAKRERGRASRHK